MCFFSLLLNFFPLQSSESKFVQFLSGYVYRGRCEILPCRAGPGPRPSAQPGHSLQRPQAREVWILDLTFTIDPSNPNPTVIFKLRKDLHICVWFLIDISSQTHKTTDDFWLAYVCCMADNSKIVFDWDELWLYVCNSQRPKSKIIVLIYKEEIMLKETHFMFVILVVYL